MPTSALVLGPGTVAPPAGVEVVRIDTADELRDVVLARAGAADAIVMAAAVADFRPKAVADAKLKKDHGMPELVLEPTPDVLAELGERRRAGQILVGFAAETADVRRVGPREAGAQAPRSARREPGRPGGHRLRQPDERGRDLGRVRSRRAAPDLDEDGAGRGDLRPSGLGVRRRGAAPRLMDGPRAAKDLVRAGYDTISEAYRGDTFTLEGSAYERPVVAVQRRIPAGGRVLDLGCGCGVPVAERLAADFDVTGVDFSSRQIARARSLVPGATFIQADLTDVELPGASFDAVVSFYAIIHIPLEEQAAVFDRDRGMAATRRRSLREPRAPGMDRLRG